MVKTDLQRSLESLSIIDHHDRARIVKESLKKASRDELTKLLAATRQFSDPVKEAKFSLYRPVSKVAEEFHRSPAMIRLLLGGNRASKTTTATVDTIISSTGRVPRSLRGVISPHRIPRGGPTFTRIVATDFPNGIEKTVKPKILEWAPPDAIVDYSAEFRIFSLNNGSKVELMTYDQELEKHGGTARHRIQFDEEPPEDIYDESLMRLADVGGEIVIAMTPVNGMTWVYDRLYLKAGRIVAQIKNKDGSREFVDKHNPEGDKNIEVFILATYDNPYLSSTAVSTIESQITDADERRMRLSGEFISFSGLIYKTYSSVIHDVEPFHIPTLDDYRQDEKVLPWPVYCALDPHPQVEHAYLMCTVDPYNRKFFFNEFFEDLEIEDLAARIKILESKYWVIWRLIDPLADQKDPVFRTSLKSELEKRGIPFQLAPKDPANGIIRVREGFATRERQGVTGRVKMPEIYFFNTLKRTKWEIMRYVWDRWRRVEDERTPKQKPRDKDDHMMENLYRIMLREPRWIDYSEYDKPLEEWRTAP